MMELLLVRSFEGLSVLLVIVFAVFIRNKLGGNRHYYANLLACGSAFLWEWYMDVGPLQLGYSDRFLSLWTINGVRLPLMIPFAYAWYWCLPNLLLLPNRDWVDRHWGKRQYLYVFLLAGLWNFAIESPATTLGGLWHYYWKAWTLGGIPATNPANAGLTSLLIYVFSRIAMRQDEKLPFGVLWLHHFAWVNLGFYLTWVPFTFLLGVTSPIWHE